MKGRAAPHVKILTIVGSTVAFNSEELTAEMLQSPMFRHQVATMAADKVRQLSFLRIEQLMRTLPEDTVHDIAVALFDPSEHGPLTSVSITLMYSAAVLVYEAAYVRRVPLNKLWSTQKMMTAS